MARLTIDTGTLGNPATGDTLRTAMTKANTNFAELYTDLAATTSSNGNLTNADTNGDVKIFANGTGIIEIDRLSINNTSITSLDTNADITLTPNGTGNVKLGNFTFNADQTVGAGQDNYVMTYDHSTQTIGLEASAGGASGITFTGDDSAGISIADGGQLYIQGGTGITTSANSDGTITITASGGSGLQSRTTKAGSASIQDGSTSDIDITGFIGYALYKVQTSHAARVIVYTSNQDRDADASRAEGVDPTADAGVIAEVITTGAETVLISPGTIGYNDDSTVTTNVPIRVTNKIGDSASTSITVTLHLVQLES